jgi:hypothetical protein
METYAQIGTIKVQFCRKRTIIKNYQLSGVTFSNEPIPETALKGRAVDVGAGYVLADLSVVNSDILPD